LVPLDSELVLEHDVSVIVVGLFEHEWPQGNVFAKQTDMSKEKT
jgi:hypothetical protein